MQKEYLGKNGLAKFLAKLFETFSEVGHTHSKADIKDFPTIPTKVSQLANDSGYKTTDNNTTYTLTKTGAAIFLTGSDGSSMSVEDSDTKIPVDSELSSSSENPVQNKVINSALSNKSDKSHDHDNKYDLKGTAESKAGEVQNNLNSVNDALSDHTVNTNIHLTADVVDGKISSHDADTESHSDIRDLILNLDLINVDFQTSNQGVAATINADTLGGRQASEFATISDIDALRQEIIGGAW